jgi:hypothetical protein
MTRRDCDRASERYIYNALAHCYARVENTRVQDDLTAFELFLFWIRVILHCKRRLYNRTPKPKCSNCTFELGSKQVVFELHSIRHGPSA